MYGAMITENRIKRSLEYEDSHSLAAVFLEFDL